MEKKDLKHSKFIRLEPEEGESKKDDPSLEEVVKKMDSYGCKDVNLNDIMRYNDLITFEQFGSDYDAETIESSWKILCIYGNSIPDIKKYFENHFETCNTCSDLHNYNLKTAHIHSDATKILNGETNFPMKFKIEAERLADFLSSEEDENEYFKKRYVEGSNKESFALIYKFSLDE